MAIDLATDATVDLDDGEMLGRVGATLKGVPRADLAADSAFTSRYAPREALVVATTVGLTNVGWTVTNNSGKQYGVYRFQSGTPAIGDYIEWELPLDAGSYRLELQHTVQNNSGVITVKVDGVAHGLTIEGYAASTAVANSTLTGVVVPTTGRRTIRLEITGKHGSSSNYYLAFSGMTLYRTGA